MVQPIPVPIGKEKQLLVFSGLKLRETGWLPPTSNTGGLGNFFSLRPDYLTLSIPAVKVHCKVEKIIMQLARWFSDHFRSGTTFEKRGGRNYYKHGLYICDANGKELLSFHWGGNRGRLFIEIKGGGCKLLDASQWARIYVLAVRYDARINRFDLAGDDWNGKLFSFAKIHAAYKKNKRVMLALASRGNKHLRPNIHDTDKGYTLEFGTDTSSYYHVIYQKFRESAHTYLGQKNPRWMRWEVRFYRQAKMEIELTIIHPDNWGSAYLGSCGYLREIFGSEGSGFIHRVEDIKEGVLDAFSAAYTANERQYGIFNAECDRLGLEVPRRRSASDVTPYASLTIYDKEELLKRIDSARQGALRSIALADESTEEVLF
jgi:DNA relaxase NicK